MKLSQVKVLLEDHGYPYRLSTPADPVSAYTAMGYKIEGSSTPSVTLTVENPHHEKNIMLTFGSTDKEPELVELFFGGYFYELEEWGEDELPEKLMGYIEDILGGSTHIILARYADTGQWCGDGMYLESPVEEECSMAAFYREVQRIKAEIPNAQRRIYEIYSWNSYERIEH